MPSSQSTTLDAAPGPDLVQPHIFSVDVEEYFHAHALASVAPQTRWDTLPSRVEHGVELLLDLLARHQAVGTFFVLGWVADRHRGVVRRIADAGHEIASHGWWHRRVSSLSPEQFRVELRDSKRILEDQSGQAVRGHRAPSFSIQPGMEWAFDVLLEEGYSYDSSLFPIRRPGYGYAGASTAPFTIRRPAGTLLELPMTIKRVLTARIPAAGGGYFRQLPYALTRAALREREAEGCAGMFYIHPWELDPAQPRLPVSRVTRMRHYGGLSRVMPRLERLCREFRFTSVARHYGVHDAAGDADTVLPRRGTAAASAR